MQIVIDIPYGHYLTIKDGFLNECIKSTTEAIVNGKILPKGHGRLIDGDRFDVISYQHTSDDFDNGVMWLAEQIDNAPVIIEADEVKPLANSDWQYGNESPIVNYSDRTESED